LQCKELFEAVIDNQPIQLDGPLLVLQCYGALDNQPFQARELVHVLQRKELGEAAVDHQLIQVID